MVIPNQRIGREIPPMCNLEETMTTILVIVVLFMLFGGGGYYGYRRW